MSRSQASHLVKSKGYYFCLRYSDLWTNGDK